MCRLHLDGLGLGGSRGPRVGTIGRWIDHLLVLVSWEAESNDENDTDQN